ncbi:MAG: hypothetical protein RL297_158 [Pseudomonadota bacterium]
MHQPRLVFAPDSQALDTPTTPMAQLLSQACTLAFMGAHAATALAQPTVTHEVTQTTRLSDWLHQTAAQHPALHETPPYPLATGWTSPEETARQAAIQQQLLQALQENLSEPEHNPFFQWLQQQAPSGRMRLAAAEPNWLDANPQRNPVLRPGDRITLASRAQHISVIRGDGLGCRLAHQTKTYPAEHLQNCPSLVEPDAQTVWVIQPDGRTQAFSLAHWNPMPQTLLAPQAILWLGWPSQQIKTSTSPATRAKLNQATAEWLATRTDGLDGWVGQWAITPTPSPTEPTPTDFTGLQGPRFEPQAQASVWGSTGLIQNPSARMRNEGALSVSYVKSQPYSHLNIMLQPFDWFEGGFRYTDVANRLYGPESLSGSQSYKDKSFEVKVRLLNETPYLPALAIGNRDLAGTGHFGSEYLVASKRWGRWDASLGLGWGYMAGNRTMGNTGYGGTINTERFFSGSPAWFGGLEYQSPWGSTFKVEHDSNHYRNEPLNNPQRITSSINVGLSHRLAPGIDLSISRERGTTWTVGLVLHTNLAKLYSDKPSDKPTPAVSVERPSSPPNWAQTGQDIEQLTQWQVKQISQQGPRLTLDLTHSDSPHHLERINKAMAVLHRDAPAHIEHIELRHHAAGDVLAIEPIDRQTWLEPQLQPSRTQEPSPPPKPHYPPAHSTNLAADTLLTQTPTRQIQPGIQFSQSLGGPDAFLLYQIGLTLDYQQPLPLNTQLHASLNAGLINNYDNFKYTAPSNLPRVRTHIREYITTARVTLPRLYLSRASRLSTGWTAAVYGGYLEEMYAGLGAEALYRTPGSPWAFGVDVNQVQQRDFAQNLSLRDYKTATGHASLYWQTPWQDVQVTLQAGRYLAKDWGSTLRVSRSFSNGSTMGAFATKTNVSAAQFGEGSFNKGVFWTIPFDAFMTRSSRNQAQFTWVPLTRDGGAQLIRPAQLMQTTQMLDPRTYTQTPAQKPNENRIPDDRD